MRSSMVVERLMLNRTSSLPVRRAASATLADLPTPVLPSNSTGTNPCESEMILFRFSRVEGVSTSLGLD